jgi:GNAT superfamily N-acetyltransferase
MSIRFATAEDIPALVSLGARVHALSRFRAMSYDAQRVAAALHSAFEEKSGRYVCFVATDTVDQVAGGLLATLERHIFSPQITASIMHFDVLPEKRSAGYALRLIKAFEAWCKNRHISEISFGINSVDDPIELARLGRFAQRLGYRKIGESYVK